MMEALCSNETSVLTRAKRCNIPKDGFLQSIAIRISVYFGNRNVHTGICRCLVHIWYEHVLRAARTEEWTTQACSTPWLQLQREFDAGRRSHPQEHTEQADRTQKHLSFVNVLAWGWHLSHFINGCVPVQACHRHDWQLSRAGAPRWWRSLRVSHARCSSGDSVLSRLLILCRLHVSVWSRSAL
jgi:hypothetical protein